MEKKLEAYTKLSPIYLTLRTLVQKILPTKIPSISKYNREVSCSISLNLHSKGSKNHDMSKKHPRELKNRNLEILEGRIDYFSYKGAAFKLISKKVYKTSQSI